MDLKGQSFAIDRIQSAMASVTDPNSVITRGNAFGRHDGTTPNQLRIGFPIRISYWPWDAPIGLRHLRE